MIPPPAAWAYSLGTMRRFLVVMILLALGGCATQTADTPEPIRAQAPTTTETTETSFIPPIVDETADYVDEIPPPETCQTDDQPENQNYWWPCDTENISPEMRERYFRQNNVRPVPHCIREGQDGWFWVTGDPDYTITDDPDHPGKRIACVH